MKLLKLARTALALAIVLTAVTSAVPALAQEPLPGQPPPPEGGGGRGGEIVDALHQIAQVVADNKHPIDIPIGIALKQLGHCHKRNRQYPTS